GHTLRRPTSTRRPSPCKKAKTLRAARSGYTPTWESSMPNSPPDSTDSPTPSATPSADAAPTRGAVEVPLAWRTNAWLFLATVGSCSVTWLSVEGFFDKPSRTGAIHALQYTTSLLGILLAHEFGHYIA